MENGPFWENSRSNQVFNFWGSFGVPRLGPDPPTPKSVAPPPPVTLGNCPSESFYTSLPSFAVEVWTNLCVSLDWVEISRCGKRQLRSLNMLSRKCKYTFVIWGQGQRSNFRSNWPWIWPWSWPHITKYIFIFGSERSVLSTAVYRISISLSSRDTEHILMGNSIAEAETAKRNCFVKFYQKLILAISWAP